MSNLLKGVNKVQTKGNLINFATKTSKLFEESKKRGELYENSKNYKIKHISVMKTTFIFILMVYWSFIILAPVLAKNKNINQPNKIILPTKNLIS